MPGRIAAGAHGGLPLNHGRHPKVFVRHYSVAVKLDYAAYHRLIYFQAHHEVHDLSY